MRITEAQAAELDSMLRNWQMRRHYNFMVAGFIFYGVMLATGYGY
jgi:hypothetical protein